MGHDRIAFDLSYQAYLAALSGTQSDSCLGVEVTCYKMLTDLLPAGTALIILAAAIIAATVATLNVSRQLKHSRETTDKRLAHAFVEKRYDVVRHKRAVAKALLEEVELLKAHLELAISEKKKGVIDPTVYPALLSEIGRLDEDSIKCVVHFYGYHAWYFAKGNLAVSVRPADLPGVAESAREALISFLEETEPERDRTLKELRSFSERQHPIAT